MTAEHSTYTYESGKQETVTLRRGPLTPHGHALLKIEYSDGQIVDCYVNTAWLRDRANDLEPRPLTPDAIESVLHDILPLTTEHLGAVDIANIAFDLHAALTEPPRPEGAEELEALIDKAGEDGEGADNESLADYLAARLLDLTIKEA